MSANKSLTFINTEISIEEDQAIQATSEISVSHINLLTLPYSILGDVEVDDELPACHSLPLNFGLCWGS